MRADLGAAVTGEVEAPEDLEGQEALAEGLLLRFLQDYAELPVVDVERRFERPTSVRPLVGYLDFVLQDGTIVELKTAAKRYSDLDLETNLQFAAYRAVAHAADAPGVRLIALIKTRKPVVQDLPLGPATETERRWFWELVEDIEAAIQAGVFPPSPGMSCRTCDYRAHCRGAA